VNRTTMLALLILAALLLTGGTVLAKSIECTGGPCIGTKRGDSIFGVAGTDQIDGRGGGDDIFGDPRSGSAGNDTIHGGGGGDKITDSGDAGSNEDIDHIFAEKGDDVINVREGDDSVDVVHCGGGRDSIFADPSDELTSCEIVNPV
jgi:Ca2+-binding RTX toxin-like protein